MPTQQRQAVYGLIRGLVGQANIIAIPRLFLRLSGGSYEQAAFLAQCVFWSDYAQQDGWFYKTYDQWGEELALSEYHIRQATAALVERGVLQTARRMVAGRPLVHYRVDFEALHDALLALVDPDYEKSAYSEAANIPPSDPEEIAPSDPEEFSGTEPEKIAGSISNRIQTTESSLSPDGEREAAAPPPCTGPPALSGTRIEHWPEGLTPNHVKALIGAGYSPATVREATVQDLVRIDGIGEKAVRLITGIDLGKMRQEIPPAVRAVQSVTRILPPRLLWPKIAETLGDEVDAERMNAVYQRWVAKGYNPLNYEGWLLDWYVNGPPQNGPAKLIPLPTRKDNHASPTQAPGADPGDVDEINRRIAQARERLARLSAVPA